MIGRSNRDAFTLLELLVVLVIIGLMAVVVVPNVGGRLDALKFKTEAKKIAATMRYARSKAVSENRVFRVIFDTEAGQIMLVTPTDKGETAYPWEETFLPTETEIQKTYPLNEGMAVRGEDIDNQPTDGIFSFVFYPAGGSSGGAVLLQGNKSRYRMTIDALSGEVRMEDGVNRAEN